MVKDTVAEVQSFCIDAAGHEQLLTVRQYLHDMEIWSKLTFNISGEVFPGGWERDAVSAPGRVKLHEKSRAGVKKHGVHILRG